MGKLHTLKRAIQRNPKAFMSKGPVFAQEGYSEPRLVGTALYCSGAQFRGGQWSPTTVSDERVLFPYRRFVRSVLVELGYEIAA